MCQCLNRAASVTDVCRVAALHQFIVERLPAGIYGSDDDIDPASRGFKILSREDLRALIDIGYAEVFEKMQYKSVAVGWVSVRASDL